MEKDISALLPSLLNTVTKKGTNISVYFTNGCNNGKELQPFFDHAIRQTLLNYICYPLREGQGMTKKAGIEYNRRQTLLNTVVFKDKLFKAYAKSISI